MFPEPPEGGKGGGPDYREARKLCARCPVRQQCGEFALTVVDFSAPMGMWAGLTTRGLRAAARKAARGYKVTF